MKNIHVFNVLPSMPSALSFLETLASNLWWCWNADAVELFRRIDPEQWKRSAHNPLRFLSRISQERLEDLARDESFVGHADKVRERFEKHMGQAESGSPAQTTASCIAYMSCEYGIHESLRLYSGGLGCLAGDHLKAASDQDLPLVAVGLLYRYGYFKQFLNEEGWQQEGYPENAMHHMPLQRVRDAQDRDLTVALPLPDNRKLNAAVWRLCVGRVPLYLLDTNIPENPPALQQVTFQLYQNDRTVRLQQELLLGIGGMRALLAMGYEPRVCHVNEGHAAFASLERMAELQRRWKVDADVALEIARRTNVFTTHTPVPAGNETFPADLVRMHLDAVSGELGLSTDQMMELGQTTDPQSDSVLSMTVMGLRTAKHCNGVSRLHGKVARSMWAGLWPRRPQDEVPIGHVTNGVHVLSWLSPDNAALYDRYLGPDWRDAPSLESVLERVAGIPDEELWRLHEVNRSRLVRRARERGEQQYATRNEAQAERAKIKGVLRPDVLTMGFARRFASYKRATLLLRDRARLTALLTDPERPIQIIVAGKAHPADDTGKGLIRDLVEFSRQEQVRARIVFLEDYDIRLARAMVQGVDVWLNTPRRPQEASGTSGMKAAVNGGLNMSCLDGWWDEAYTPEIGWSIGRPQTYDNEDYQDRVESLALYNLLETEVIPAFYERSHNDIPEAWVTKMKASIRVALGGFTSGRMLAEYNERYYQPALKAYEELTLDQAAFARKLVEKRRRLEALWGGIAVTKLTADRDMSRVHVGEKIAVAAIVRLGDIRPDEVEVQVYYGPVSADDQILESHVQPMDQQGKDGSEVYRYACELICPEAGRYGLTARVVPHGGEWAQWAPGFVCWAEDGEEA